MEKKWIITLSVLTVILSGASFYLGKSYQISYIQEEESPSTRKLAQNIPERKQKEWTALMLAAYAFDSELVQQLIDQGADVNQRDLNGKTPLIITRSPKVTQILLDNGADIDAQDKYGWTALIDASKAGFKDTVKVLVDAGANLNLQSNHDLGYYGFVHSHGEETNKRGQRMVYHEAGQSALMEASRRGHTEVVRILVDAGASVNLKGGLKLKEMDPSQGWTALGLAAARGNTDIVEILLDAGVTADDKENALMNASTYGHDDTVTTLLQKGNIESEQVKVGALLIASEHGHTSAIKVLLDTGQVDINSIKPGRIFNETALNIATEEGWGEVVSFLKSQGAKRAHCLNWIFENYHKITGSECE